MSAQPEPKRYGTCSEDGKPLYHPAAKVCSARCRQRRARRIKAQNKLAGERLQEASQLPEELNALRMEDELKAVAREELRPVVREALTADVLGAAAKLVGLTSVMVDAIEADIKQTSDPILRQKAYTLLARYTLGNASIAPQPQEAEKAPMVVHFQLPRPGDDAVTLPPAESVEIRRCAECDEEKPAAAFVGASDRCLTCHDRLQSQVNARFGQ